MEFVPRAKMIRIGKYIEKEIGEDREYIIIVADKEGKGRSVQFNKNMPLNRVLQRFLEFNYNLMNGTIINLHEN